MRARSAPPPWTRRSGTVWRSFASPLRTPFERSAPLRLDGPRIVVRQRRQLREAVDPGERLDGLDDELGMRGDAALLRFGRDARIERRAPGIADDVGLLRRLAARR